MRAVGWSLLPRSRENVTVSRWQLAPTIIIIIIICKDTYIQCILLYTMRHMGSSYTQAVYATTTTTTTTMNRKMRYLFTYSTCVSPPVTRALAVIRLVKYTPPKRVRGPYFIFFLETFPRIYYLYYALVCRSVVSRDTIRYGRWCCSPVEKCK